VVIGRGRGRVTAAAVTAAQALAMWAVLDVAWLQTDIHVGDRLQVFLLYDFKVYLNAGRNFAADETVYLDHVLTALPPFANRDFFLYPPVLLPLLAGVAALPNELTEPAFALLLVAAGVAAFRLIGLSWFWALLLISYPPLFKGVISGNVANITFLFYAAAPFAGALLVLGLLFKLHAAIPALWLIRERRWRDLLLGMGILLALVLVTLPLVGVGSWTDFVEGLRYREQSQRELPILFGSSLAQHLPLIAFGLLALAAVGVALAMRGRKSLAMIGVASVIASPSLWPHGFIMALPAVLALPAPLLWLILGLATGGAPLWLLPLVGTGAILVNWERLRIGTDPAHPLANSRGPWSRALPERVTPHGRSAAPDR
jgi:hypothetical protein